MKCPKCGSANISTERRPDGFNTCLKCGYKWQDGVKQPEPTTAEMLYWLVESGWFQSYFRKEQTMQNKPLVTLLNPRNNDYCFEENDTIRCFGNTFDEAIDKAYEEAKKQEEQND